MATTPTLTPEDADTLREAQAHLKRCSAAMLACAATLAPEQGHTVEALAVVTCERTPTT